MNIVCLKDKIKASQIRRVCVFGVPHPLCRTQIQPNQESLSDFQQSISGPFAEPVDGGAVDERWVLEQPLSVGEGLLQLRERCQQLHVFTRTEPEELSHWTHAEDDVQVVPDPLDQIAEHEVWSLQHVVFLGRICQSVANLQEGQKMVIRHAEENVQLCEERGIHSGG